jgi:hypothetical protein
MFTVAEKRFTVWRAEETRMRAFISTLVAALLVALARPDAVTAQTFNSGSTGADGAFAPTADVRLEVPPDGVFNFTTVTIPAGVTVSFATSAGMRRPPVSFLATGNVTIAGRIDVSGHHGGPGSGGTQLFSNAGAGGPGGFDGGPGSAFLISAFGAAGLGPGGGGAGSFGPGGHAGHLNPGAGNNAGRAYGDAGLVPLVGGSGGGGGATQFFGDTAPGGGGGGGALLIAASGTLRLDGVIAARGGTGGGSFTPGGSGSGGAVRLVATTVTGTGRIDVEGGPGASPGRVRIEGFTVSATIIGGAPGGVSVGTPDVLALDPVGLRIASVGGVPAPPGPRGSYDTLDVILPAGSTSPVVVELEARHIPLGTTITVTATPLSGPAFSAVSTPLTGTIAASTATATLALPPSQPSILSATASFTLGAAQ